MTEPAARHGRLAPRDAAPARGERTFPLASGTGFAVEQIISGQLDAPQDYDQDHDEWVVLLEGAATLDVEGETQDLVAGDWLLLRAHVRHRVTATAAGTRWLAVHLPA